MGGAGAVGGARRDGGEYFAQLEESAGFNENHIAGATGKPRDAGVHASGNENDSGGDGEALYEAESVVASQPASGARGGDAAEMQCVRSCAGSCWRSASCRGAQWRCAAT